MKILKKISWFTLIELLVVIWVAILLFLVGSQLDFNRIWNKEKVEIFNTKVLSHFETIRNNALLWKAVGTSIEVPDKWKIIYSSAWNGSIVTQYTTNNGTNWETYNEPSPAIPEKHSLKNLKCVNLEWIDAHTTENSVEIIFDGNDITLWWICNNVARIVTFESHFLDVVNKVEINVLNGNMDIQQVP